jgi:hypothetical protein
MTDDLNWQAKPHDAIGSDIGLDGPTDISYCKQNRLLVIHMFVNGQNSLLRWVLRYGVWFYIGLDKKLVKLARWLGTKVLRLDSFIF